MRLTKTQYDLLIPVPPGANSFPPLMTGFDCLLGEKRPSRWNQWIIEPRTEHSFEVCYLQKSPESKQRSNVNDVLHCENGIWLTPL